MGSNGIVTEKAHLNVNKEQFDEGHKKIFGERIKIDCLVCDLSSRQKIGDDYNCPHCDSHHEWNNEKKKYRILMGG